MIYMNQFYKLFFIMLMHIFWYVSQPSCQKLKREKSNNLKKINMFQIPTQREVTQFNSVI